MSGKKDSAKRLAKKKEKKRLKRLHKPASTSSHSPAVFAPAPAHNIPTKFTMPLGPLLEQAGPLVLASWSVPAALAAQLLSEGKPVPPPVHGYVLVDTGAGKTCVAQHTAEALGLTPQGTCNSFGAHGSQTSTRYLADFRLGITNNAGTLWLTFENHEVMGIPKMKESFDQFGIRDARGQPINIIGVLGREFLRHTKLKYDGPYGSSTGITASIADDRMVVAFFEKVCALARHALPWFGHAYFFCDWRSWSALWEAARRAEMSAKNVLVWDKGGGGLGSMYAQTYEQIGFFVKQPAQTAVKGTDHRGHRTVHRPNMLRFARPTGEDRKHNAAKPVGLLRELIVNSSDKGKRVFDPFVGSGSTLLAAEMEGRICDGIDIEPKWIDITIERWEKLTSRKAERLTAGS